MLDPNLVGKVFKQKRAVDEIFERYFRVRLPYLQSRSYARIEAYGIRVSGVPEIDVTIETQMIETEMTINAMLDKFRMGVTISLVNYNDSAEVYRIIYAHLTQYAEYLNSGGVNVGNIPFDDLRDLDKFASVVYDKAVSVFDEEGKNAHVASIFKRYYTVDNVFKTPRVERPKEENQNIVGASGVEVMAVTKTPEKRKHESYLDVLDSHMKTIGDWRRNDQ